MFRLFPNKMKIFGANMQKRKAVEVVDTTIALTIGRTLGEESGYPARNTAEHNIITKVAQNMLRDSLKLWGNRLILKASTKVRANDTVGITIGIKITFPTQVHIRYQESWGMFWILLKLQLGPSPV